MHDKRLCVCRTWAAEYADEEAIGVIDRLGRVLEQAQHAVSHVVAVCSANSTVRHSAVRRMLSANEAMGQGQSETDRRPRACWPHCDCSAHLESTGTHKQAQSDKHNTLLGTPREHRHTQVDTVEAQHSSVCVWRAGPLQG